MLDTESGTTRRTRTRRTQVPTAGSGACRDAGLSRALRSGLRTVLPSSCAGCGRWETRLCPRCRALLSAEPQHVSPPACAGLSVVSCTCYAGPVRRLVLSWKNGGREDLGAVIEATAQRAGASWAQALSLQERTRLEGYGCLLVVPAPSGLVRRLRGRLVAARLADAVALGVARVWQGSGPVVLSVDLLRRRGGRRHQSGLSARQRRLNRSVPPRCLAPVQGRYVLLVDDVVTTGATLGACARSLREAGATVEAAVVLAATPRRGSVRVPGGNLTPAPTAAFPVTAQPSFR